MRVVGSLLYTLLVGVGGLEIFYSLFFAMATDACHDSACDASYHVWPAMSVMWIGVGTVLLATLIVMALNTSRAAVFLGSPCIGLLALGAVYLTAIAVLH